MIRNTTYDLYTLLSVLFSMVILFAGMWFFTKVIFGFKIEEYSSQPALVKMLCYILWLLTLIYTCNSVVWVRRDVLSKEQSEIFMRTIIDLIIMVFSFHFGKQSNDKK
jgi:hypothetical protein